MATGVHEIADEAVRRARAARGFLVAFAVVTATRYAVWGLSSDPTPIDGLAYFGCFVTSVLAVRHGYRYGHREGRTAAYLGLLVTTAGMELVVAFALRPPPPAVSGITRPTR